ncbi:hypothetical protein MNBD_DELTA01-1627 [hydrothermal vent metagenome]|uniref:Uncharacterized protein n=1 Tax=hydrothermal vent metagenome TaxID=652676 RepID=A0A3B0QPQ4_9ZZZZ
MSGENKKDVIVAIKAKDEFSDIMNRFKDSVHNATDGTGTSSGEVGSDDAGSGYGTAVCCNANTMVSPAPFGSQDGDASDGTQGEQTFGALAMGALGGVAGDQGGGDAFDGSATLIAEEEARVAEEQALIEDEYVTPGTEGMSDIERYNFENQLKLAAFQEYSEQLLGLMDVSGAAQADTERKYSNMKIQYSEGEKKNKLKNVATFANMSMSLMQALYTATGSQNKKMFKVMQAYEIGKAIVNTIGAGLKAYNAVPYPMNFVAMATTLAAGYAQVQKIRAQKPGGASGGSGVRSAPSFGGGGSSYSMPQRLDEPEEKQTQRITMNIYNPLSEQNWAEIAENNIIPALNDASERNINLTVKTIAA